MDDDQVLVWDTLSSRQVLMNADCPEYDVRDYRDTRPWPAADVMKSGCTTIAVECGRAEPSRTYGSRPQSRNFSRFSAPA